MTLYNFADITSFKSNNIVLGATAVIGVIGGIYLLTQSTKTVVSRIAERKAIKKKKDEQICNVCLTPLDTGDLEACIACCSCAKYVCRGGEKCSEWVSKDGEWRCRLCSADRDSYGKTSTWVQEQCSVKNATPATYAYPMRARSEIYIPLCDPNDSAFLCNFESVSDVLEPSPININQKQQIREYIEEVLAEMLGGSLDSTSVGPLSTSRQYVPAIGNEHELQGISHVRLRRLIESIIAETVHLPSDAPTTATTPDPNGNQHPKGLTLNGNICNGNAGQYFEPKQYQDLLATAVLNKIVDTHGNGNGRHSESSPDLTSSAFDNNHNALFPNKADESISSSSSVEPRSESSLTDPLHRINKGDDTSPIGSFRNFYADDANENIEADRESILSDFLASHMVPLPHISTDPASDEEEEEEDEDFISVASSGRDATWEDNWLFKKKRCSKTASSIGMLVPAPKEDVRALIGDKPTDEVSDLSEVGSDTDDSSLEMVSASLEPLNDRLVNQHLIGGKNTKVILDELVEQSSMISTSSLPENIPPYTETKNDFVVSNDGLSESEPSKISVSNCNAAISNEAINSNVSNAVSNNSLTNPELVAKELQVAEEESIVPPPNDFTDDEKMRNLMAKFKEEQNGKPDPGDDNSPSISPRSSVSCALSATIDRAELSAHEGITDFCVEDEESLAEDTDILFGESSSSRRPTVIEILAAIALGPMLAVSTSDDFNMLTEMEVSSLMELNELAMAELKKNAEERNARLGIIAEESFDSGNGDENKPEAVAIAEDSKLLASPNIVLKAIRSLKDADEKKSFVEATKNYDQAEPTDISEWSSVVVSAKQLDDKESKVQEENKNSIEGSSAEEATQDETKLPSVCKDTTTRIEVTQEGIASDFGSRTVPLVQHTEVSIGADDDLKGKIGGEGVSPKSYSKEEELKYTTQETIDISIIEGDTNESAAKEPIATGLDQQSDVDKDNATSGPLGSSETQINSKSEPVQSKEVEIEETCKDSANTAADKVTIEEDVLAADFTDEKARIKAASNSISNESLRTIGFSSEDSEEHDVNLSDNSSDASHSASSLAKLSKEKCNEGCGDSKLTVEAGKKSECDCLMNNIILPPPMEFSDEKPNNLTGEDKNSSQEAHIICQNEAATSDGVSAVHDKFVTQTTSVDISSAREQNLNDKIENLGESIVQNDVKNEQGTKTHNENLDTEITSESKSIQTKDPEVDAPDFIPLKLKDTIVDNTTDSHLAALSATETVKTDHIPSKHCATSEIHIGQTVVTLHCEKPINIEKATKSVVVDEKADETPIEKRVEAEVKIPEPLAAPAKDFAEPSTVVNVQLEKPTKAAYLDTKTKSGKLESEALSENITKPTTAEEPSSEKSDEFAIAKTTLKVEESQSEAATEEIAETAEATLGPIEEKAEPSTVPEPQIEKFAKVAIPETTTTVEESQSTVPAERIVELQTEEQPSEKLNEVTILETTPKDEESKSETAVEQIAELPTAEVTVAALGPIGESAEPSIVSEPQIEELAEATVPETTTTIEESQSAVQAEKIVEVQTEEPASKKPDVTIVETTSKVEESKSEAAGEQIAALPTAKVAEAAPGPIGESAAPSIVSQPQIKELAEATVPETTTTIEESQSAVPAEKIVEVQTEEPRSEKPDEITILETTPKVEKSKSEADGERIEKLPTAEIAEAAPGPIGESAAPSIVSQPQIKELAEATVPETTTTVEESQSTAQAEKIVEVQTEEPASKKSDEVTILETTPKVEESKSEADGEQIEKLPTAEIAEAAPRPIGESAAPSIVSQPQIKELAEATVPETTTTIEESQSAVQAEKIVEVQTEEPASKKPDVTIVETTPKVEESKSEAAGEQIAALPTAEVAEAAPGPIGESAAPSIVSQPQIKELAEATVPETTTTIEESQSAVPAEKIVEEQTEEPASEKSDEVTILETTPKVEESKSEADGEQIEKLPTAEIAEAAPRPLGESAAPSIVSQPQIKELAEATVPETATTIEESQSAVQAEKIVEVQTEEPASKKPDVTIVETTPKVEESKSEAAGEQIAALPTAEVAEAAPGPIGESAAPSIVSQPQIKELAEATVPETTTTIEESQSAVPAEKIVEVQTEEPRSEKPDEITILETTPKVEESKSEADGERIEKLPTAEIAEAAPGPIGESAAPSIVSQPQIKELAEATVPETTTTIEGSQSAVQAEKIVEVQTEEPRSEKPDEVTILETTPKVEESKSEAAGEQIAELLTAEVAEAAPGSIGESAAPFIVSEPQIEELAEATVPETTTTIEESQSAVQAEKIVEVQTEEPRSEKPDEITILETTPKVEESQSEAAGEKIEKLPTAEIAEAAPGPIGESAAPSIVSQPQIKELAETTVPETTTTIEESQSAVQAEKIVEVQTEEPLSEKPDEITILETTPKVEESKSEADGERIEKLPTAEIAEAAPGPIGESAAPSIVSQPQIKELAEATVPETTTTIEGSQSAVQAEKIVEVQTEEPRSEKPDEVTILETTPKVEESKSEAAGEQIAELLTAEVAEAAPGSIGESAAPSIVSEPQIEELAEATVPETTTTIEESQSAVQAEKIVEVQTEEPRSEKPDEVTILETTPKVEESKSEAAGEHSTETPRAEVTEAAPGPIGESAEPSIVSEPQIEKLAEVDIPETITTVKEPQSTAQVEKIVEVQTEEPLSEKPDAITIPETTPKVEESKSEAACEEIGEPPSAEATEAALGSNEESAEPSTASEPQIEKLAEVAIPETTTTVEESQSTAQAEKIVEVQTDEPASKKPDVTILEITPKVEESKNEAAGEQIAEQPTAEVAEAAPGPIEESAEPSIVSEPQIEELAEATVPETTTTIEESQSAVQAEKIVEVQKAKEPPSEKPDKDNIPETKPKVEESKSEAALEEITETAEAALGPIEEQAEPSTVPKPQIEKLAEVAEEAKSEAAGEQITETPTADATKVEESKSKARVEDTMEQPPVKATEATPGPTGEHAEPSIVSEPQMEELAEATVPETKTTVEGSQSAVQAEKIVEVQTEEPRSEKPDEVTILETTPKVEESKSEAAGEQIAELLTAEVAEAAPGSIGESAAPSIVSEPQIEELAEATAPETTTTIEESQSAVQAEKIVEVQTEEQRSEKPDEVTILETTPKVEESKSEAAGEKIEKLPTAEIAEAAPGPIGESAEPSTVSEPQIEELAEAAIPETKTSIEESQSAVQAEQIVEVQTEEPWSEKPNEVTTLETTPKVEELKNEAASKQSTETPSAESTAATPGPTWERAEPSTASEPVLLETAPKVEDSKSKAAGEQNAELLTAEVTEAAPGPIGEGAEPSIVSEPQIEKLAEVDIPETITTVEEPQSTAQVEKIVEEQTEEPLSEKPDAITIPKTTPKVEESKSLAACEEIGEPPSAEATEAAFGSTEESAEPSTASEPQIEKLAEVAIPETTTTVEESQSTAQAEKIVEVQTEEPPSEKPDVVTIPETTPKIEELKSETSGEETAEPLTVEATGAALGQTEKSAEPSTVSEPQIERLAEVAFPETTTTVEESQSTAEAEKIVEVQTEEPPSEKLDEVTIPETMINVEESRSEASGEQTAEPPTVEAKEAALGPTEESAEPSTVSEPQIEKLAEVAIPEITTTVEESQSTAQAEKIVEVQTGDQLSEKADVVTIPEITPKVEESKSEAAGEHSTETPRAEVTEAAPGPIGEGAEPSIVSEPQIEKLAEVDIPETITTVEEPQSTAQVEKIVEVQTEEPLSEKPDAITIPETTPKVEESKSEAACEEIGEPPSAEATEAAFGSTEESAEPSTASEPQIEKLAEVAIPETTTTVEESQSTAQAEKIVEVQTGDQLSEKADVVTIPEITPKIEESKSEAAGEHSTETPRAEVTEAAPGPIGEGAEPSIVSEPQIEKLAEVDIPETITTVEEPQSTAQVEKIVEVQTEEPLSEKPDAITIPETTPKVEESKSEAACEEIGEPPSAEATEAAFGSTEESAEPSTASEPQIEKLAEVAIPETTTTVEESQSTAQAEKIVEVQTEEPPSEKPDVVTIPETTPKIEELKSETSGEETAEPLTVEATGVALGQTEKSAEPSTVSEPQIEKLAEVAFPETTITVEESQSTAEAEKIVEVQMEEPPSEKLDEVTIPETMIKVEESRSEASGEQTAEPLTVEAKEAALGPTEESAEPSTVSEPQIEKLAEVAIPEITTTVEESQSTAQAEKIVEVQTGDQLSEKADVVTIPEITPKVEESKSEAAGEHSTETPRAEVTEAAPGPIGESAEPSIVSEPQIEKLAEVDIPETITTAEEPQSTAQAEKIVEVQTEEPLSEKPDAITIPETTPKVEESKSEAACEEIGEPPSAEATEAAFGSTEESAEPSTASEPQIEKLAEVAIPETTTTVEESQSTVQAEKIVEVQTEEPPSEKPDVVTIPETTPKIAELKSETSGEETAEPLTVEATGAALGQTEKSAEPSTVSEPQIEKLAEVAFPETTTTVEESQSTAEAEKIVEVQMEEPQSEKLDEVTIPETVIKVEESGSEALGEQTAEPPTVEATGAALIQTEESAEPSTVSEPQIEKLAEVDIPETITTVEEPQSTAQAEKIMEVQSEEPLSEKPDAITIPETTPKVEESKSEAACEEIGEPPSAEATEAAFGSTEESAEPSTASEPQIEKLAEVAIPETTTTVEESQSTAQAEKIVEVQTDEPPSQKPDVVTIPETTPKIEELKSETSGEETAEPLTVEATGAALIQTEESAEPSTVSEPQIEKLAEVDIPETITTVEEPQSTAQAEKIMEVQSEEPPSEKPDVATIPEATPKVEESESEAAGVGIGQPPTAEATEAALEPTEESAVPSLVSEPQIEKLADVAIPETITRVEESQSAAQAEKIVELQTEEPPSGKPDEVTIPENTPKTEESKSEAAGEEIVELSTAEATEAAPGMTGKSAERSIVAEPQIEKLAEAAIHETLTKVEKPQSAAPTENIVEAHAAEEPPSKKPADSTEAAAAKESTVAQPRLEKSPKVVAEIESKTIEEFIEASKIQTLLSVKLLEVSVDQRTPIAQIVQAPRLGPPEENQSNLAESPPTIINYAATEHEASVVSIETINDFTSQVSEVTDLPEFSSATCKIITHAPLQSTKLLCGSAQNPSVDYNEIAHPAFEVSREKSVLCLAEELKMAAARNDATEPVSQRIIPQTIACESSCFTADLQDSKPVLSNCTATDQSSAENAPKGNAISQVEPNATQNSFATQLQSSTTTLTTTTTRTIKTKDSGSHSQFRNLTLRDRRFLAELEKHRKQRELIQKYLDTLATIETPSYLTEDLYLESKCSIESTPFRLFSEPPDYYIVGATSTSPSSASKKYFLNNILFSDRISSESNHTDDSTPTVIDTFDSSMIESGSESDSGEELSGDESTNRGSTADTATTTTTTTSNTITTNNVTTNQSHIKSPPPPELKTESACSKLQVVQTRTTGENEEHVDDDPLKHLVPGSIAEREYKKWYNAVDMPNNPYSVEALKRRLSGGHERVIDLPNISPSSEEKPIMLADNENKEGDDQSQERDYARYSRDYYINDAKHASGTTKKRSSTPATTPSPSNERTPPSPLQPPALSSSSSSIELEDRSENTVESLRMSPVKAMCHKLEKQCRTDMEGELYTAIPVRVEEDLSQESAEEKDTQSVDIVIPLTTEAVSKLSSETSSAPATESLTPSEDSDTIRIYDLKKQETRIIKENQTTVPKTPLKKDRPTELGITPTLAATPSSKSSTPTSFKFLQPKRKLIDPSQVLSIDLDTTPISPSATEKTVIEEDVVHAMPSVRALAQAFLLTSSACSKSDKWRKARVQTALVNQKLPEPAVADTTSQGSEDATIASDLSSLETDPPSNQDGVVSTDSSQKSPVLVPGCLRNNIAFFENLKNK